MAAYSKRARRNTSISQRRKSGSGGTNEWQNRLTLSHQLQGGRSRLS